MENEQSHAEHAPGYGVYVLVWLALLTFKILFSSNYIHAS